MSEVEIDVLLIFLKSLTLREWVFVFICFYSIGLLAYPKYSYK